MLAQEYFLIMSSTKRNRVCYKKNFLLWSCRNYQNKKASISLGNLNVERDWGFAGDYVNAMWLMLQNKEANDYVIATGKTHSVRKFVEKAFSVVDIQIEWTIDNKLKQADVKKPVKY